jgi:hypothetical protein
LITAVYEEAKVKSNEAWLSPATLGKFPAKHQILLLIMDWLVYADGESMGYAWDIPS